jgi:hypothetical protein
MGRELQKVPDDKHDRVVWVAWRRVAISFLIDHLHQELMPRSRNSNISATSEMLTRFVDTCFYG